MSNWSLPTLTSTYTNFLTEVSERLNDAAKQNRSDGSYSNLPVGSIRWNVTASKWESNTGTAAAPAWTPLATTYAINVSSANTLSTARTVAITGDTTAAATSFNGSANISLATTLADVNASAAIGGTTYGSASAVPIIVVNKKGLVTSVTTAALGNIASQASNNVSITGGAISGTSITLVQSTTASPVAEGRMEWDTDNDVLVIGTATATKVFNPSNPTSAVSSTNQTLSTGCTWNGNTIAVGYGGTGVTTLTGVVYGTGTTAMRAATGAEVASALGTTDISGKAANVTGTIAVANGGTGATTLTGIVYGTGTTAMRVATGAEITTAIGTNAVTNATNATTVTNGVYTTGDQTIGGAKTFSAKTNFSSGTAALPSIAFSADGSADTGFYWISDGVIGMACNAANVGQIAAGGNLTMVGNITAYSDERLKSNWVNLPLDFVDRLALVKSGTYTRIDTGKRQAGSSAQDWQSLLPEAVVTGTDSSQTLSLAYGNAALVAAVELAKRVMQLEQRIAALEAV